jgi:hypothetical protein
MTRNEPSTTTRLPEWLPPAVAVALGVPIGWTVLEWALRRDVVPLLADPLGGPVFASVAVLVVGFPLIAGLLAGLAIRGGQQPDRWGYRWSLRVVASGVGCVVVGLVVVTAAGYVDRALFDLGEVNAQVSSGLVPALAAEPTLAVLFLLGNGVIVPLTEELVWRGVVQTELVEAWGPAAGIGVTAVLFALKHVVVDQSVARVTTLLALALVFGLVRYRFGTVSSTVTHIGVNTVATAGVVFLALS